LPLILKPNLQLVTAWKSKKVKRILIHLKSDVGRTAKYGGYKRYEISLLCNQLVFIAFDSDNTMSEV